MPQPSQCNELPPSERAALLIGLLRGRLIEKQPPFLILDVAGVGYELQAPLTTCSALSTLGEENTLFTHLVVREDSHQLFAFITRQDRDIFRLLLKVNGIGPKVALTLLSGMETALFISHIENGDALQLSRLPGVGRKTAERIIMDLQDRLPKLSFSCAPTASQDTAPNSSVTNIDIAQEAVAALIALGFKPADARRRISACTPTSDFNVEDLIRKALQSNST